MTILALKNRMLTNLPDNAGLFGKPLIVPRKHREVEEAIIDELKARGVLKAVAEDLADLEGEETDMVFVTGYGLFQYVSNGLEADDVTVFAAKTTGFWQLQKMFIARSTMDVVAGAVVTPDLSAGDIFKLAIDQNATIAKPTGVKWDGKQISVQITQTGAGGFTPQWEGGAGGFAFSATRGEPDLTGHPAASITKVDFEYSKDLDRWICVDVNQMIDMV